MPSPQSEMIAIAVKQGVKELKFNFPENWGDLSFRQLHEIVKLKESETANNYELVRVILGLDKASFETLPIDFFLSLERVLLDWVSKEVDLQNKELPNVFWFRDKATLLPTNIGELSIAQYKDAQQIFTDLQELAKKQDREILESEMLGLYPLLLATYLQPILEGKEYNYKEADLLIADIWECAGLEVLAFANFFFHKVAHLRSGTKKGAQKFLIQESKYKLVMKVLRRVGALFLLLKN